MTAEQWFFLFCIPIMAVYFGVGKLVEMVFLFLVTVVGFVGYNFWLDSAAWKLNIQTVAAQPEFYRTVLQYMTIYTVNGFAVTLLWFFMFTLSVKKKYQELVNSQETLDKCDEFSKFLQLSLDSPESSAVAQDWIRANGTSDIKASVADIATINGVVKQAKCLDVKKALFDFGPTLSLVNPAYLGRAKLDKAMSDSLSGAVYTPKDCNDYLSYLLPPKAGQFKKVLVWVWILWPVALTWLLFYHIAKAGFTFMVERLTNVYDKLASKVFGRVW